MTEPRFFAEWRPLALSSMAEDMERALKALDAGKPQRAKAILSVSLASVYPLLERRRRIILNDCQKEHGTWPTIG